MPVSKHFLILNYVVLVLIWEIALIYNDESVLKILKWHLKIINELTYTSKPNILTLG